MSDNKNKKLKKIEQQILQISNKNEFTVSLTAVSPEGKETGTFTVDGNRVVKGDVAFYFPKKILKCLLVPKKRFYLLRGGRSAGKSHSIARFCLALAVTKGFSVLCLREIQSSMRDSVHRLLRTIIEGNSILSDFFIVGEREIRGRNGATFIFHGCQGLTVSNIKSFEGFDCCWVEESQSVSGFSWTIINPTIRKPNSKIFLNLNPERATDPLYELSEIEDARVSFCHVDYRENPFCPEVIREDAEIMKSRNEAQFTHVYLGGLAIRTDEAIFRNWIVEDSIDLEALKKLLWEEETKNLKRHRKEDEKKFESASRRIRQGLKYGADFGFTAPSAAIKLFHDPRSKRIWILDEVYRPGMTPKTFALELRRNRAFLDVFCKENLYCDSADPAFVLQLKELGVRALPCSKLEIRERISYLQDYRFFIDEKCENFIREITDFRWETTTSGNRLDFPAYDCVDHLLDAMFYSLGKSIVPGTTGGYEKIDISWG